MLIRPLAMMLCFASAVVPSGMSLAEQLPSAATQETTAGQIERFSQTLQIRDVIEVMRLEGLDYGAQMQTDMFPEKGGAGWRATVEMIYDETAMQRRFDEAFSAQLAVSPDLIAPMQSFFESPRGQTILKLETEARKSLLDPAVEDAARARAEDMIAEADPRMESLREFAEVNDLIEANVSGALNANLAFFQGMAEVDQTGEDLTEEQMLTDVWDQEPDIRTETEAWLFPYLALAYGPLSDEDLGAYIAFSKTDAGKKLNRALFAAFDVVFSGISRDLGRAVARQMMGEDI